MSAVRAMSGADVEAVAAITAEAALGWPAAELRAELARPHALSLVLEAPAREGGGPLGVALLWVLGADAELLAVAIRGDARRRGHGRALMQAAIERARERGAERVLLEVRADNEAAISLYRALGFRLLDTRRRYYAGGTDALVMELPVGET